MTVQVTERCECCAAALLRAARPGPGAWCLVREARGRRGGRFEGSLGGQRVKRTNDTSPWPSGLALLLAPRRPTGSTPRQQHQYPYPYLWVTFSPSVSSSHAPKLKRDMSAQQHSISKVVCDATPPAASPPLTGITRSRWRKGEDLWRTTRMTHFADRIFYCCSDRSQGEVEIFIP